MTPARVVVFVIDGLGVGEMPDTAAMRPADIGADTLRHVAEEVGGLSLPTLSSLGLGHISSAPGLSKDTARGAYGKSMLAYSGADTYMGHQELMGTIPGIPKYQLMREVRDDVRRALETAGHQVEDYLNSSMLLVDGSVVVHDNMETDPGRNINVTASYDDLQIEDIVAIGEIVRSAVLVSRVIVVMGSGFHVSDIAEHIREEPGGAIGVDSPGLGVYDENYRVRHLGIGVDVRRQVPNIAHAAGLNVYLLGKAADVVECPEAIASRDVLTADVLEKTVEALRTAGPGLIVSNVQEGDLAGHSQDSRRWANVLRETDEGLRRILELLRYGDILIVVGDHGNDPTIGHSQHTREFTPLLVAGPSILPGPLGIRTSLADAAATAADILQIQRPLHGESFQNQLLGVRA